MTAATSPQPPEPSTDLALIPEVAKRLRAAFDEGRTRPLAWRRQQLERMKALVRENKDALLEALHADLGKPALEGNLTDLSIVIQEADLALKNLERWTRPEKVPTPLNQQPAKARIVRDPLGVVLVIAPWNYPVQLLLSPAIGAIAAGNAMVLKPSEVSAHVSNALARLVPQYLDTEAIAVVEGAVAETQALLEQRWDHVFYTGNGKVGRIVMKAAAEHLTPVTLELGGKSPCIVDESADLEVAARRIAWGKFMNAGQTCIAPDYVLVSEAQREPLLEKIESSIREFYGEDPSKSGDYGRIVNERHHARLTALLEGQKVAFGGKADASERYLEPTVLDDVDPESPVMQEEIFGPILPVLTVRDTDEAVSFVRGRDKPLALYVFAGDTEVAEHVVESTSSGGVCVNATIWHIANPNLPFGGVGPSGMGAYHGRESFETFSHRKAVVSKSTRVDPKIAYPPYGGLKGRILERLM